VQVTPMNPIDPTPKRPPAAAIPKERRTWRHWAVAAAILIVAAGAAAVVWRLLASRPRVSDAPVAVWSAPPVVGENLPTAGATHTCLLTRAGTALCWGTGAVGQLGVGSRRLALVPMAVTAASRFASISAGASHTCGVTSEGKVLCWGLNEEGQAGIKSGTVCTAAGVNYDCTSPPDTLAGLPRMRLVRAGGSFSCGLAADGVAYCWGGNRRGQMGRSTGHAWDPPGPVGSRPYPEFRDLATGQFHACGVTTAGTILCWGWGLYGQLGTAAKTSRCTTGEACADAPAPVDASGSFSRVTAGAGHTCALGSNGRAFCWGSNTRGQLGTGSTREKAGVPVAVAGGLTFTGLAAGSYFTCGINANGEVWCWGDNSSGQVGTAADSTPGSGVPVRVPLDGRALSIGAGDRHACAILEGDRVVCWGNDGAGQLGDGQKTETEPPVTVRPDSTRRPGGGQEQESR
jgi:alpha-tubulin suppressor-like RCC1 family protein